MNMPSPPNAAEWLNTLALTEMANFIHGQNLDSGWWDGLDVQDPYVLGTKIALMHSELSECLEGVRKGLMDDHLLNRSMEEVELADTIIRILDYAGARNLDIGGAVVEKLDYNSRRADHKRDARAKEGGKKF